MQAAKAAGSVQQKQQRYTHMSDHGALLTAWLDHLLQVSLSTALYSACCVLYTAVCSTLVGGVVI